MNKKAETFQHRPFDPKYDYETVLEWWKVHHVDSMPLSEFLSADGVVVSDAAGNPLAMGWLFREGRPRGAVGMIEFVTMNPHRPRLGPLAVTEVYSVLEDWAWRAGCGSILTFGEEKSGIEKRLKARNYLAFPVSYHRLYGLVRPVGAPLEEAAMASS